jgi:hypothetical protein
MLTGHHLKALEMRHQLYAKQSGNADTPENRLRLGNCRQPDDETAA